MRAFDFSGADRKTFGEGLAIFQLVFAGGEITMAYADRGLVVTHIVSFAVGSQGPEDLAGAPRLQRVLLRLHPGNPRGDVRRDCLRGRAQILANMIEIDQVAALFAEQVFNLARSTARRRPPRAPANPPRSPPGPRRRKAAAPLPPRRLRSRRRTPGCGFPWRARAKSSPPSTTASSPCACPFGWRPAARPGPCLRRSGRRSAYAGLELSEIPAKCDQSRKWPGRGPEQFSGSCFRRSRSRNVHAISAGPWRRECPPRNP